MSKITSKQQKVVRHRFGLAAPIGYPSGGERVPEIQEPHGGALAVRDDAPGQVGEYPFGFPMQERFAGRADE